MTTNDPLDDNLKKLLSSSQPVLLTMPAGAKARILNELTQQPKPISTWRMFMRNKLMRFCAAAAAIALVAGGFHLLKIGLGTSPAWAIEQTIEAMKDVRLVHITGTLSAGEHRSVPFELWATPNSDQSGSEDVKLFCGTKDRMQISVHDNRSYEYRPAQNTVRTRLGKQLVFNPWLGSKFFETAKSNVKDWSASFERDPQTGREYVCVTCSYEAMKSSWWFQFDPETKMLTRFKQWDNNTRREGPPQFIADTIVYNEPVPENFFKFEIPKGASVIDVSALDDARNGMLMQGLAEDGAAIKICTDYWNARILGNWTLAHTLRPTLTEKQLQAQHAGNPPVRIVGIGTPYRQEGCSIGPVVPCTIEFKGGQIRTVRVIVQFRKTSPAASCVIAGTWGSETH